MPNVHFRTSDGELPGYFASPSGPGPWPGVVVIMDALGMTADLRANTDRIAAQGYVALAPDLYARRGRLRCITATIRASRSGHGPAYADIDAARRFLGERDDCTGRVGIIGFCMGGGFALMCGLSGDYSASSVNYGFVPDDIDERLGAGDMCPVVGSFGKRDVTLRGHAGRYETALSTAGVPHDIKEYDGVGHSFLNRLPGNQGPMKPLLRVSGFAYDGDVANDAWSRIFAFFDQHLRS
ncbi:MAG: dienelactone hydrolase family protein [Actinomycetes bacterium]